MRDRLLNAIKNGRAPHAVLITGPEGSGRRELARRAAALFLHVPLLHVRPPFRLIFTDTKSSPIYKILYPVCPRCSTVIPATF